MHAPSKFGFHLIQLCLHSLANRLPQYRKLSIPCLATDVHKTEKVERLRFPLSALPPSLGRISSESQQTRFLGMQFQAELLQTLLQFLPELFGIPSAVDCSTLFGDFSGCTSLSDFPRSFIIVVRP
jgi:hypothetical protein